MSGEPKGSREKTGNHSDIKACPLISLLNPGLKSDQMLVRAGQSEADQGLFRGVYWLFWPDNPSPCGMSLAWRDRGHQATQQVPAALPWQCVHPTTSPSHPKVPLGPLRRTTELREQSLRNTTENLGLLNTSNIYSQTSQSMGFPGGSAGKESACNAGDLGLIPGWGDPLEKGTATTPVFWPGEFHGLYNPWGHKESGTTERLSLSLSPFKPINGSGAFWVDIYDEHCIFSTLQKYCLAAERAS